MPIVLMAAPLALLAGAAPMAVDAPVLTRTVNKGELLSASDFTTKPLSPATARGAMTTQNATGQEATRRLSAGNPVRAADISSPRVVRRGEAVTLSLVSGALRITAAGRALHDAAKGEPVRVVNTSTNRTLDGIAADSGEVRIAPQ